MKIKIINGPNLNMLGKRNLSFYGKLNLTELKLFIEKNFPQIKFVFIQSNIEGVLVDEINKTDDSFSGLIINPAAYSYTSVAIKDALEILNIRKIEVHLSNLFVREEIRRNTITASACDGIISGFKEFSYILAVELILSNSQTLL